MEYIETIHALVVDDSDFFASLTADQLETEHGIRTVEANSPEEAMSILEERTFDCVVSDYDMPETNGLEFYQQLQDGHADLPFILLTSRTGEEIVSEAIGMGIDEYLQKEAVSEQDDFEVLANRLETVVSKRKARKKYELVVDTTPEPIAQVHRDGQVLAANDAFAEAFDTRPTEITGELLGDIVSEGVAASWQEHGEQALAAGERMTLQTSHDGRYYDTIVVPVDISGETDSYQIIARNITSRVEREQELEQTTEQLELINRFVRHDIRNDINLVYAWADLLEDRADEEAIEYAERIVDVSEHIIELTDIAGEFVEIVSGDGGIETEPVSLSDHLDTEFEKCKQSYDDATFERNHELPRVTVSANGMLSSVFRNLLNNAVQHNDSEQPEVRVSLTVDDDAGTATVIIADNGPGVPTNQRETIFGKGEQGTDSSGTGIGLYLVHTLVSQYGGEVWVEDSHLGGAAFYVELPLVA